MFNWQGKNGHMKLILLDVIDEKNLTCLFMSTITKELVKGFNCKFTNNIVSWSHGDYYGEIKHYIKFDKMGDEI